MNINKSFVTTLTDEQILIEGDSLLSNPTISSDVDGSERLYSYSQMVEMFRKGFDYKIIQQSPVHPYGKIRMMDIGDCLVFPYEKWNAVRSAAAMIKKVYGGKFNVFKLAAPGEAGNIKIIRTA